MDAKMEKMEICVQVVSHKKTDLLMAFSNNDLKGLLVHGRTYKELERKVPDAVKMLLEEQGHTVLEVKLRSEEAGLPEDFQFPGFIADASLEDCRA